MKKLFAVTTTAAFVLTSVGAPAFAQEDEISIGGLVWLDRNGDRVAGDEPGLAGEKAVRIAKADGGEVVGEYTTDAEGRYAAKDLPAGKYRVSFISDRYRLTTVPNVVTEGGAVDFGAQGYGVAGRSFFDRNGDGLRQADEDLLSPGTLNGKPIAVSREDGQFSVEDLPAGEYEFIAADYTQRGLALVEPKGTEQIDWATGELRFKLGELEGPAPLDALYLEAKADIAVSAAVTPTKDTHTVGDRAQVEVTLSNKGNVPVTPSVVMAEFAVKVLKHSDNVKFVEGRHDDFETTRKILPGEQARVTFEVELNDVTFDEVWPIVRFNFGHLKDVDRRNNVARLPIKVVEKGAETTAPVTSPSETTAAPTTTTTAAVAQAGNRSGLASTGASPLGFIGLGALLLAAGTSAFFVARRRRS
ncbi:SdrD B-like domain-containing protein [Lentzea flaviverrucosa]|uniref:Carboxypeptidase regulatory-like domain-containing protein n=1 Tax=Lentzea flaviverrucosa TaxID=200379 RepID=A0A1H9PXD2_9PSEU|nr:SdrD B-like domain-containing protein [Lentzea flaviverrucosa]RDI29697.1 SdrD B-like protein [Lentzea flaviverrucosa]SER52844.1 Carboxypeptidase regulatory-like domain-containing protein [Lentzea flaviverrucosa]